MWHVQLKRILLEKWPRDGEKAESILNKPEDGVDQSDVGKGSDLTSKRGQLRN